MISPSLELQGRIVTILKENPEVVAIVGDRVFDHVPRTSAGEVSVPFPYVSIGPSDELSDDFDCIDSFDISFQIDGWSRAVGTPEVRRIADVVRRALRPEFELTTNAIVSFSHTTTRIMRDPDNRTNHAAMTFRALIEQPDE